MILLALVAPLLARFAICSLRAPFKNCLRLESRALFAPRVPSAKTTACNTPYEFRIPSIVFFVLLLLYTPSSSRCWFFLCKKGSSPSMGGMILKAAEMRNHRKGAFSGLPVNWISTIFAPLIAPRFAPKTIASAERADKKLLTTDHDANMHPKCKHQDASFMILVLWLSASHVFKIVLPACMGSTILQNDFKQIRSFFSLSSPPNGLNKSIFVILFALIALLPVPIAVFRFLSPLTFCKRPMTYALLASWARSAKTTACITPTFL